MSKIVRVGVTFPPDLLKDFDDIIGKMGYESLQSHQDAVRLYVPNGNGYKIEDANQTGVILMVYDHDARTQKAT